jgi:hypothetical protein
MRPVVSMILLVMGFSLVACETPEQSVAQFRYTKDPSTKLCFALYHMFNNNGSMTYVPCTPEVEDEIKREASLKK